jgi:ATPase subunit of ABC transporter with duplicated ATPase domains
MTGEPIVDVRGLTKHYDGRAVVDHVDLRVRQGEIVGFLGPNGSGKTTTIRMICGLLRPDEGSGTCLGYDILTDADRIKLQVGYMTQRFSLYEGGFKQSSQHPDVGGCDEHWKAAVGSVWTSAITVTRSAACDGAQ